MRALIVGTGSIGRRHMHNLELFLPGVDFILLRRDNNSLPDWLRAKVTTSLDAALDMRPDFAILATPSAFHIDVLPHLIVAGVPTYVEKPIVTTHDHAKTILELLAHRPESVHVAGFNLRHLPSILTTKSAARHRLGQIARASFTAGQWLPDWRKGADHRSSYSASRAGGGGVLFDLCHEFDSARFILGELELLSAATSRLGVLQIDSEAVALAIASTSSGTLVTISLDYIARQPIRRYEIVGTEGTLVWDLSAKSLSIRDHAGLDILASDAAAFDVSSTYVAAMRAFVEAVRSAHLGDLQSLADGIKSSQLPTAAHFLSEAQ